MDLFQRPPADHATPYAPLADRMRPRTLDEFVGQEHILGKGSLLRRAIEQGTVGSLILWGPPGTGKTTLAHIIARSAAYNFVAFSAVTSGIKEIKKVIEESRAQRGLSSRKTLLFVDEIHRFNKAQQDAFLPHIERGIITFIGATTENPSFEVVSPLLSRSQVVVLEALTEEDLLAIVRRAMSDREHGLGSIPLTIEPEALLHIARSAHGDARVALNALETLANATAKPADAVISLAQAEEALRNKALLYDKSGEEHYNLISALHKSLRDSNPDAALYWLGRMLEAGEDPLFIARRMVRFASEDIGNADPRAVMVAVAAKQAFEFIGLPEGELALAQAAIYLATASKSNALYTGYSRVKKAVHDTGALPVPMHIRNAPTRLMKDLGYGKGYQYAHDYVDAQVDQEHMPEKLKGVRFYFPTDRGYEKIIRERMEQRKTFLEKDSKKKEDGGGL